MIYKIYIFQYEANQFLYGLGKGHQQYIPWNNDMVMSVIMLSYIRIRLEANFWNVKAIENFAQVYLVEPTLSEVNCLASAITTVAINFGKAH